MRILKVFKETCSDGPGIRYSIYVAGCNHRCKGCHNPESWEFKQGKELDDDYINSMIKEIESNPLIDGITISGGDPMFNPKDLYYLLNKLSPLNKDVWVYTGFTIEELLRIKNPYIKQCFKLIDTLVEGRFEESLRELSTFKGSTNQRFIKTKQL